MRPISNRIERHQACGQKKGACTSDRPDEGRDEHQAACSDRHHGGARSSSSCLQDRSATTLAQRPFWGRCLPRNGCSPIVATTPTAFTKPCEQGDQGLHSRPQGAQSPRQIRQAPRLTRPTAQRLLEAAPILACYFVVACKFVGEAILQDHIRIIRG